MDLLADEILEDATLSNIKITALSVRTILQNLKINSASGPDEISPCILKKNPENEISAPLATFFNLSLQTGNFPTRWKEANASPIFKKGKNSLIKNYRPISLLSCISKVME